MRPAPVELRKSLDRRWIVEDIKTIQPKDIEIKKTGSGYIDARLVSR